jgi:hypothetical protein
MFQSQSLYYRSQVVPEDEPKMDHHGQCLDLSLTLQNISDDAMQWKENELADLDDDSITIKLWNDWGGFKKRFLENWEEIDSSGNAYTELQKLQKRKFAPDQKQMSLIKYTEWFKELIRKADVEGSSATHQFGQGLTLRSMKRLP